MDRAKWTTSNRHSDTTRTPAKAIPSPMTRTSSSSKRIEHRILIEIDRDVGSARERQAKCYLPALIRLMASTW